MRIMRALMDCSEMTRMCADMMMRRSPLANEMCMMCAQACDMCAEACMSMPDDERMTRCAESCRRCSEMSPCHGGRHDVTPPGTGVAPRGAPTARFSRP
ncbi:hypothetical protein GCM10023238_16580 [Streptomyces heliomycini]